MRRAVVASVAGLGVVGSLAAPAALAVASPASGVATALAPPAAREPRLRFSGASSAVSADTAAGVWDVVPGEGTPPRRVADPTSSGGDSDWDAAPSYSPDGTRAVFSASVDEDAGGPGSRLMVVDVPPAGLPLPPPAPQPSGWEPGTVDETPDWSPRGDRIVFALADVDGDLELDVRQGRAYVSVESDDESLRPLADPDVVQALQELTRLAVQRETGEFSRLILDIGGSRDTRREQLAGLVDRAIARLEDGASQASLPAMGSYERKIIHDIVAERGYVSESYGERAERHTVVRKA